MSTITIPSESQGDNQLIAIPKKAYKEFLAWQKKVKKPTKVKAAQRLKKYNIPKTKAGMLADSRKLKTYHPTAAERRAFARAEKEFARGECFTLKEVADELGVNLN